MFSWLQNLYSYFKNNVFALSWNAGSRKFEKIFAKLISYGIP